MSVTGTRLRAVIIWKANTRLFARLKSCDEKIWFQFPRQNRKPKQMTCMETEPEPITDEERRRDAESEALILQITKEDPGYWDRLADRIIAEAGAEGGSITMEELLGLPPIEEGR